MSKKDLGCPKCGGTGWVGRAGNRKRCSGRGTRSTGGSSAPKPGRFISSEHQTAVETDPAALNLGPRGGTGDMLVIGKRNIPESATTISPYLRLAVEDRLVLAESPNTTIQALLELSKDSDRRVRALIADQWDIPADVLFEFADESDAGVAFVVASNHNSPPELLTRFANNREGRVRRAVARNRNTSLLTLTQLATDDDWNVRKRVALNPETPSSVIVRLANDHNVQVRDAVGTRATA